MVNWLSLVWGLLGGFANGTLGFVDANAKSGDEYDRSKFIASLVRGAIAAFATSNLAPFVEDEWAKLLSEPIVLIGIGFIGDVVIHEGRSIIFDPGDGFVGNIKSILGSLVFWKEKKK